MTLLISAKCNDGILLSADSAVQDLVTGLWSATGIKWLVGERGGRCYALVFGGDAIITDKLTTLDALTNACRLVGNDLHHQIATVIKEGREHEYVNGPFNSEAERQLYGNASVMVYLASDPTTLWRLEITRHGAQGVCFNQADMDLFDLPGDSQVREQLMGMRAACPTVMEAAAVIGSMFELACANLEAAKFPGIGVWVRPSGAKIVKFGSRAELIAGMAAM